MNAATTLSLQFGTWLTVSQANSATHVTVWVGDPTDKVRALNKGDLVVDVTTPALWLATAAGKTAWSKVGGSGGGGVTPTETPVHIGFTSTAGAGGVALGPTTTASTNAVAIGNASTAGATAGTAVGLGAVANHDGAAAFGSRAHAEGVNALALGNTSSATGTGAVALGQGSVATGQTEISIGPGTAKVHMKGGYLFVGPKSTGTCKVFLTGLPTSTPAVAGQLWNDAGTLKVSAG